VVATTRRARPDEEKVASHWGATLHEVERTFYGFPPLRAYFYRSIAGKEPSEPLGRDWFERWAVAEVLGKRAPVAGCLSLCCGFGEIERILARLGAFRVCTGVDLAAGAIEEARRAARDEGIDGLSYAVLDLESAALEPESVELVWANGALHHIARLEHVCEQVHRALRPGGILIANEYVGPDLHQLGPRAVELVNAVIHLIPAELRDQTEATFVPERFKGPRWLELAFRGVSGRLPQRESLPTWQRRLVALRGALQRRQRAPFGRVWANNPWYYRHVDPSEGVRASDILPVLRRVFHDVEVRPYNGSILPHALDRRFYETFDPSDERHVRLLGLLVAVEEGLVDAGEIEPHHAAIVCRKEA
jgi:SAM-dependent methyltransferase